MEKSSVKGKIADKYQKIKCIGNGGFGRVNLCTYNTSEGVEKQVAIKKFYLSIINSICEKENKNSEEAENFVKNQFDFIMKLDHENIIKPIEYLNWKKNKYIVFEYIPGNLVDLIRKTDLSFDEIKKFSVQIFAVLDYLHKKKIIHRDIKPDNFLMDENGKIYLTDFDLSRFYENAEQVKTKGPNTLYYKPPEILLGSKTYDEKIDIWAAGCTLVEMILKKPMFKYDAEFSILMRIMELLGSPNENDVKSCTEFEMFLGEVKGLGIREFFIQEGKKVPEDILEILEGIFILDPRKRFTAEEILKKLKN